MKELPEFPPRPYMSPSAGGAVGACLVSAFLLHAAWRCYVANIALPVLWAVLVAAFCAAVLLGLSFCALVSTEGEETSLTLLLQTWGRWFLLGACLAGISCTFWMMHVNGALELLDSAKTASAYVFATKGDPSINNYGATTNAVAKTEEGACSVRVSTKEALEDGTTFRAVGTIERLSDDERGRSRFMQGQVGFLQAVSVTVSKTQNQSPIFAVRTRLLEVINPAKSDAQALIAGVLCGRTTELSQTDTSDDFAKCGLSHLVAVSGGHLALIANLLLLLLQRSHARPRLRAGILITIMALYVVFTGGAASAVRSLIMVLSALLSGLGGRRAHSLSALSLTVSILVIFNPGIVFNLGFQLSAASVLFISLFAGYIAYLLSRMHIPAMLAQALALTLAAQVAVAPLSIPTFGDISLVAPLANLVAGPLMSALLVCGLLCTPLAAAIPACTWVVNIPRVLAQLACACAEFFAQLPLSSLHVQLSFWLLSPLYVLAFVVYLAWADIKPRMLWGTCTVLALVFFGFMGYWRFCAPAAITVLNVGQADAILIRDGASSLLVDAGVDSAVLDALARQHVFHLDAIAITHWDEDHWGGLPDVLASIDVDVLYVAKGAKDAMPTEVATAWEGDIQELQQGDALAVGAFSARVVWPQVQVSGTENEDSLCLDVRYSTHAASLSMLLTGDSEVEQEHEYAASVGDIDVLKLGHHGSKASVDEEVLSTLCPEVAIASAGEGNSYGHPTQECINAVTQAEALFFCTKDNGDISVYPAKTGVKVVSN